MAVALRGKVAVEDIESIHVSTYWMTYSEIGSESANGIPARVRPRTIACRI